MQKIKDAYAEKGYFLADVEIAVEPQRDNEVIVKFKITEHQPVTVRRITFVGNYNVPDDELRAVDADRARAASSRSAPAARTGRTSSSATC